MSCIETDTLVRDSILTQNMDLIEAAVKLLDLKFN